MFLFGLSACKKENQAPEGPGPDPGIGLSPEMASLVSSLEDIYFPLSTDPSLWEDEELAFLDALANTTIFAMGEASHGTAEFFKAKARVFQYLVEYHGYRVFAIEADMAECMIINEAIREGEVDDLAFLMMEKMLFWTWKTDEVKELLNWMVRFNRGRDADDMISYVGVDCQLLEYTVPMLLKYLQDASFPHMELASTVLNRVKIQADQINADYSSENYETDLVELQLLRERMVAGRANLEAVSSEWNFRQYYRLAEVPSQCAELSYAYCNGNSGLETRDRYIEIHEEPMNDQKRILDKAIAEWMGDNSQIDDIMVLGVRA